MPVTIVAGPPEFLERLRSLCPRLRPDEVVAERRGDRLMVRLPGERLAWIPMTPAAGALLRMENRVLGLIGARCSFAVPTVVAEAEDGSTVRSMVPGQVDPDGLAARLRREPVLVPKVGQALATILAEQHARIGEMDVAWLPSSPQWPMPQATIVERLPRVLDDMDLRRRIGRLLDAYDDLATEPHDKALVHSDLGLHNIAYDADTAAINGVFDYGDAAWADRHLDFRYLVFGAVPDALLDAVTGAYRDATDFAVDRHKMFQCNAAAAVSHLADRDGHAPDEVVAGRTLAGDLRWTEWALRRAGFT